MVADREEKDALHGLSGSNCAGCPFVHPCAGYGRCLRCIRKLEVRNAPAKLGHKSSAEMRKNAEEILPYILAYPHWGNAHAGIGMKIKM